MEESITRDALITNLRTQVHSILHPYPEMAIVT